MRIGIDAKGIGNGKTGIARYLSSLMDCLQLIDLENEYFLFECRQSEYCITNKKWKKIYTPWRLPGIVWQQIILPYLLYKYRIDILWAPEQTAPFFISKRTHVLVTIHDFTALRFPKTCQYSSRLIQKLFLRPSIIRARWIMPVSEFIRKELEFRFRSIILNKNIVTVTNGKPNWTIPSDYNCLRRGEYLFFAGNLEPRKNLKNVLKALVILHNKGKDIELKIAGPGGWNNKDIHEFLNSCSIKNNINFLGYISEEELKKHYLYCKAVIYPSIYEGFGIPILEALLMDSIVLTSKGTVMEEIAGDTAVYFDPDNPMDIAEAIEKVFNKFSSNKEKYLANVMQVLNKYTWEESANKIKKLFDSHRSDV